MSLLGNHVFPLLQIIQQCSFDLGSEINDCLIAALSPDLNSIHIKIDILNIQPDTFRHTDTGAEKQRQKGNIPIFCLFVVFQFLLRQLCAVFHLIQKNSDLVRLQPDDLLCVFFWHGDKRRRIIFYHFPLIKIVVKAPQGGELALLPALIVRDFLTVLFIQRHIFQIFFNIHSCQLFKDLQRKFCYFHFGTDRIPFVQELKEEPDVIGVGKSCPG